MKRIVVTVLPALIALLAVVASPGARAQAGWGVVLKDSVAEDFHDEDLQMHIDAVRRTLATPLPAEPVTWSNPASGAGGSLQVVGQPKVKGYDECRRVKSELYSKRRKGVPNHWTACKEPGGGWKLVRVG